MTEVIISVPCCFEKFCLGWLGSCVSGDSREEPYAEMQLRAYLWWWWRCDLFLSS